jgi:hypothetical protein
MAKFLGIADPERNIITVPNRESGGRKRPFVEKLPAYGLAGRLAALRAGL